MTHDTSDEFRLQRSSRDAASFESALTTWLAAQAPTEPARQVALAAGSDSNGMSSETILATLTEPGSGAVSEVVLRMAPSADDVPVFQQYRLDHQYEAIRLVGLHSEVPVPAPRWLEPTGDVLGAPFFIMDRIDGIVPPDVMPYTFGDNWLFDADPADRQRLQDNTVATIAGLHRIDDAGTRFAFLDDKDVPGSTPLHRHLARTRAWYEWAAHDVGPSELVPRALAWLESHWPGVDTEENLVLCWGDARIGNMLFQDFEPVAVLDWEMAAIGPRELDLGWLVFAHRVFQSLAETFELPGMPDFLRAEDVATSYAALTGHQPGDLDWFQVYAAVQWAVVFMRTGARQAHFGEIEKPASADALMHHAPLMAALLDEVGA